MYNQYYACQQKYLNSGGAMRHLPKKRRSVRGVKPGFNEFILECAVNPDNFMEFVKQYDPK